jgi:hypothetical protein
LLLSARGEHPNQSPASAHLPLSLPLPVGQQRRQQRPVLPAGASYIYHVVDIPRLVKLLLVDQPRHRSHCDHVSEETATEKIIKNILSFIQKSVIKNGKYINKLCIIKVHLPNKFMEL